MIKLDGRQKKILLAVIQSHIDLNTPIGSIMIAKRFPVGLSPATIRNTMGKLEKLGYITQPHTSAGRIPTEKGYRYYVDTLMEEHILNINSSLPYELSTRLKITKIDNTKLIKEATKTLSSFSRYLAIATPPAIEDTIFQRIKFIKYETKKILTVMISEDGVAKNKIIELDKVHTQHELDKAADYLNNRFSGLKIKKVREKIAFQLYKEKAVCDQLIANLLYHCKEIVTFENDYPFTSQLSGASNLPDFASLQQIKGILQTIEDKKFMLKLLNQINESHGIQVFVGTENFLPAMRELSMVISEYRNKKQASGAIGIIGPTSMNYKEMIPIVAHTAKALTTILSEM